MAEPEPDSEPEQEEPSLLPGFEDFKFDSSDFSPLGGSSRRDDDDDDLTEERSPLFLDESDRIPTALSPRAPRRTPEPGRRRRRSGGGGGIIVLWTMAISLLVAGVFGGVVYLLQDEIARLFPMADQALQAAGLRGKPVGVGLEFRSQRVERISEGNREVLVIRGVIANIDERPHDVPWVRAVLLDDKNVVVMEKLGRPPGDGLDAGATTVFSIRLESPHPNAKSINLLFALPPLPKG